MTNAMVGSARLTGSSLQVLSSSTAPSNDVNRRPASCHRRREERGGATEILAAKNKQTKFRGNNREMMNLQIIFKSVEKFISFGVRTHLFDTIDVDIQVVTSSFSQYFLYIISTTIGLFRDPSLTHQFSSALGSGTLPAPTGSTPIITEDRKEGIRTLVSIGIWQCSI